MHLLAYPALDQQRTIRLQQLVESRGSLTVTDDLTAALRHMPQTTGFLGKITPELLAASTRLRWVQAMTASLEHYLFPELIAHPCQLTNMRGLFSDVVADHALLLLLAWARQLKTYLQQQTAQRWAPVGGADLQHDFARGPGVQTPVDRAHVHLGGLIAVVIGLGGIGRAVVERFRVLGMEVIGIDPRPQTDLPDDIPCETPGALIECLPRADVVCIAAPLTPSTHGLFNAERIAWLKRGAFLINVGRGPIVSTAALVAALQSGHLGGAGIDVLEHEPLPPDSPLWQLPNVIITPHVGAASPVVSERHFAVLSENVRRFVADEPLLNLVDKHAWC